MKIYTKEQLEKYIFNCGFIEIHDLANDLIPSIELPSDEEIEEQVNLIKDSSMRSIYILGAKWMRDKIQGGNK